MKYLLYTDYNAYIARLNKCTDDAKPTWTDDITQRYADEKKHPTEDIWAIPVERYNIFTQQELESAVELDESWFPKMEFPL